MQCPNLAACKQLVCAMLIVYNHIQSNYTKQREAAASNYWSHSNTIKTCIAIGRSVYMQ